MNTVETVLVILLSVGFLVLLSISIVLVVMMVGIMRNVKKISERAEEATGNVADLARVIGKKVAPFAASSILAMVMKKMRGGKGKKGD